MKRALILRAYEDAARTAEKLKARGYESIISPVLEIAATDAAIPQGDYDAMLATSSKGIELAGGSPVFPGLTLHAVGAKTAAAARARGWSPEIVAGNAEAILPLLLARYETPANFLYLAGRDRQPTLENGLKAANHRLTTVCVYEARATAALAKDAIEAIASDGLDAALHYSRRSVTIFLSQIDAAGLSGRLGAMRHLALSADVAVPLQARGLEPLIAATPDEAGLLDLLPQN